jgi:DNA-binding CsgD family transcriptional regulator
MPRISEVELGRITTFLAATAVGTPADPVPRVLLARLQDLVGADDAEYFELRRVDRAVLSAAESHDHHSVPGADEALLAYGHQNPIGWRRWRPTDGAMRLSGRIGRAALRRTDFYNAGMRPNGLTDILKIWLHSDARSVACVQLWRQGAVFTQHQEDVLGIIQPHLIRLREEAIGEGPVRHSAATVTRREAEVLTWAVRGESDAEIAARLSLSVGTVGKHLENAFAALGVHSRTEALWRLQERSRATGAVGEVEVASVVGSRGDPAD